MARHALSIDDKAVRRGAILDAALTLFLEDTRRFPTISAITVFLSGVQVADTTLQRDLT